MPLSEIRESQISGLIDKVERTSRLKVYKAVFEPKVTQDASELGVGVVFVS